MSDGADVCADQGEIQFTDYGLSGIPVFQVSRFAAEGLREGKPVSVILDFLPEMQETEICALFREKQKDWSDNTAEEFLRGNFSPQTGKCAPYPGTHPLVAESGEFQRKKILQDSPASAKNLK